MGINIPDFDSIHTIFIFSVSVGFLLLLILSALWFLLYGKDKTFTVGDYLTIFVGLFFIPIGLAIESKPIRILVLNSFIIFCIGGSFACLRMAYFRFIKDKDNKKKHDAKQKQIAYKNKRKRVFSAAKAKAFSATRRASK